MRSVDPEIILIYLEMKFVIIVKDISVNDPLNFFKDRDYIVLSLFLLTIYFRKNCKILLNLFYLTTREQNILSGFYSGIKIRVWMNKNLSHRL